MTALERFLARLLTRSALSEQEADAIRSLQGEAVVTKARGIIVRPGQTTNVACLVERGLVGRFDQLSDGGRQIAEVYIPGDMCDLHSVAVPRTGWGITALTDTTTVRIPHSALLELADKFPNIRMAFWRDTVADASIMAKRLSVLGRLKAKARLAHFICGMGLRMEQARLGTRTHFPLPLTQAQLADVLGITLTHIHTCLTALRRQGRIRLEDDVVEILDLDYLMDCAQFDPSYLLLSSAKTLAAPGHEKESAAKTRELAD
jgi:CRP-like cAMP-binding protein